MIVVLEGTDGCGKTTVARKVADLLPKAVLHREPGGTLLGERIRALLLEPGLPMTPLTALLLFNAARAQLLESLREVDDPIVFDRFWFSTFAYQGGMGIPTSDIQVLCDILSRHYSLTLNRRLCFYLDVSPEVARERMAQRGSLDRFERLPEEQRLKIRRCYEQMVEDGLLVRIDANRSVDEVASEIHRLILRETL